MGRGQKCVIAIFRFLFVYILLMNSLHSATQARPLISARSHGYYFKHIDGFRRAVNESGPSKGGPGHRPKNSQSVAGINTSGPSHGAGHNLVTGNNK
ncbi:hypothetical protein I3843_05G011500 [Carya illinoinensis]|uniref:Uncharacterized protein n=1 Tax=Carya illinoinensis TaxID=32201 RepID=A0A922EXS0_CARIL|nr:hypothetical protein I3760_05G011600 [Carya illinoinensis]KAG6710637.1 hypothetical protein I3842_05G012000 [Carya illinoinensis]KAG7977065.1 hypothetical protein I3843_05G011500 [Carya illinoinensis]